MHREMFPPFELLFWEIRMAMVPYDDFEAIIVKSCGNLGEA